MLLRDLFVQAGVMVRGCADIYVKGIAYADVALEDEIAIALHKGQIEKTLARVVLTPLILQKTEKILLFPVELEFYETAVAIAGCFVSEGYYKDYSLIPNYKNIGNYSRKGEHCQIASSARIGAFTSIGDDVIIGDNCLIEDNVTIGSGCILGDEVILRAGARIGTSPLLQYGGTRFNNFPGLGKVIIGSRVVVGPNSVIERGTFTDTVIGDDVSIGALVMVGHDARIGDHCLIVGKSGLAGGVTLEDCVRIYGGCGINGNVRIGRNSVVKGGSCVWKDIPEGSVVSGLYGRKHNEEMKLQARLCRLARGGK